MDLLPASARRLAPLLVLALVVGTSAAGCADGGDHGSLSADGGTGAAATVDPVAGMPSARTPIVATVDVPQGTMTMPTAEAVSAAWAARPAFVTQLPAEWQGAYAFALARPDVLQWLPCYCGCEGSGHRSNLDCFFQERETGVITFEEHGSYCDVCINTANLAASMLREGKTMVQIRAAVDDTFSGGAPGTVTPLPPA